MMFASRGFRVSALLATLVMAFSLVAVDTAEARRGGSFGGRGIRTERVIPATPVSPNATPPVQRTMTNGPAQNQARGNVGAPAPRPSLFGGLGGALLGGLLFSGLFGMLFGFGFGGFGGFLSLLVQVAVIALIVRFFLRRRQTATPGGGMSGPLPFGMGDPQQQGYSSGPAAPMGPRSNASQRAGGRDEIGITDADLDTFERRLTELQDAYSREDYSALRRISTPEVMSYLAEELAENATKGQRNEVSDVKLLAGDVAEAWSEPGTDYATVAMRYESRDLNRDRTTGRIVSGDDTPTETTELWTFARPSGGDWLVSAIQET